ncbi:MAG: hypothetical protein IAE79_05630 [Anaerolinea sp.]|nr:hypothetical protein [Anaerolinea sp.]
MQIENRELKVILGLLALILPVLFFASLTLAATDSGLPDRPPTMTPLPAPTDTPEPVQSPTQVPPAETVQHNAPVAGGFLLLQIVGGNNALWTEMQWLASDGAWMTVDGWRGNPSADGVVMWYVGPENLGFRAWFRWLVFDKEGGQLLATSDAFKLPGGAQQVVPVTVTVDK